MGEEENRKQVYESCKVTSDECCPACEIKGLTRTLQTYRISFKESIILCENPQCIYPLGHKPLQSITTVVIDSGKFQSTPNPAKRCPSKHSPRKRKLLGSASQVSLSTPPLIGPCVKHLKVIPVVRPESSLVTDCRIGQNENISEQKTLPTDIISDDPPKKISPSRDVEHCLGAENIETPCSAPQKCIQNSNSDTGQFPEGIGEIKTPPVIEPSFFVPCFQGKKLHLQWRNRDALCWLDCILASFVHLKTLKRAVAEGCNEKDSIFKQLLSIYNQANALLTYRCRGEGNAPEVSLEVLDQAENHLNDIRNAIFDLLQPQLKCELGKNDMPVFALPLLVQKDSSFQKLFEHSFVWKFECLQCGFRSQDRCRKALTTFTRLIPEWHPLHAVHVAPCNNCLAQSQRREMILEQVPEVFMLHFSEGLPHNNLKTYSFQFEGGSYEISMIIQYQSNHFVTWVLTSDGSWLECDDLKGPYCCYQQMCEVPPSEIHIVYWEKNLQSASKTKEQMELGNTETFPLSSAPSSSPLSCDSAGHRVAPTALHNVDISGAPSLVPSVATSDKEKSILGFKDLAADAMITLTLVEIHVDSAGRPLENAQVIRKDDTSEKGAQKPQDKSSASSLQNPLQGETSPTDMVANECPESESSIMSVEGELPNPMASAADADENHSTCPPTIAEGAQPSDIEEDKLINSAVSPQGDIHSSLACEGNEPEEDPSSESKKSCKKGLSTNWVDSLIGRHPLLPSSLTFSNQKLRSRNLKDNSQQKTSATQQKNPSETSPAKVTDGLASFKKASSFCGFIAKGLTKCIEEEAPDPVSGCTSESFPPGLQDITGLPVEHLSCTENNSTTGTMSGEPNTSSQQMTSDKEPSLGLNEPSKHTDILNENKQSTSSISGFVKDLNVHKLRLELRRLKAKKNELTS
ncbi:SUMO-specific isopeptidase USPL1 isoform X4 [Lissotriton helveticus]